MLPTSIRRIAESATAEILGPVLEPGLSTWQAARRRGTCRRNVAAAFAHLAGEPCPAGDPAAVERERLAQALFGDMAAAIYEPPAGGAGPAGRSVLLADQSKAFERAPPAWVDQVLAHAGVPRPLRRLVRAFLSPRWAISQLDPRAARRLLLTGIGTGGPITPLIWNLTFDPVVRAVQVHARARAHVRR